MISGEQIEVSHLELNSMVLYDLCLFGIINGHLLLLRQLNFNFQSLFIMMSFSLVVCFYLGRPINHEHIITNKSFNLGR